MKTLLRIVGVIAVLVIALILFINLTYQVDFTEEYPVDESLTVEVTPERVAHGEYLAYGPAHCAHCHISLDQLEAAERGEHVALSGGFELNLPPATLRAPNITMDVETGIGGLSDGELYRMLRYNVLHDGTTTIELMPFSTMSDEDIFSLIAFLRSQDPVKNEVAPTEWSMIGKAIKRFALVPMDDGLESHPVVERAATAEYGEYLAASVANCRGCHTQRDLKSGAFTGPEYAGGMTFEPTPESQGWQFVTPNLTPDKTGIMYGWDESTFFTRMKSGRVHMTSPMPWGAFAQLDSTDLGALWQFFSTIEPVEMHVDQIAFEPAE